MDTRSVVAAGERNQLWEIWYPSWKKRLFSLVCEEEGFARKKRSFQVERTTYTKALRYEITRIVWGNTSHYLWWEYGVKEGP